jgi:hypothetical protein
MIHNADRNPEDDHSKSTGGSRIKYLYDIVGEVVDDRIKRLSDATASAIVTACTRDGLHQGAGWY